MAEEAQLLRLTYDQWQQVPIDGAALVQVFDGAALFWVSATRPSDDFLYGFIRRQEDDFNGTYTNPVWVRSMGGDATLVVISRGSE